MTPRSAPCWGATPHGAGTSAILLRRSCGKVAVALSGSRHSPLDAASYPWGQSGEAHPRSLVSAPVAQELPPAPAVAPGQPAPARPPPCKSCDCPWYLMHQRYRVRRTLYEGKWVTAIQSGISEPRFVRYPGPNFYSTVATHRFRSAARASFASLASRRAFGNDASSSPNLTAVTRSARKIFLASSSFRPPARTSSAVAFLG